MKACALDIAELVEWSQQEAGMQPSYCEVCRPNESEPLRTGNDDRHLTRLGKEIVDYVVEGAVIHLDWHDAGYNMTIADIAAGLDKTRAQISSALVRLERDGYLRFSEDVAQQPLPAECRVFPTPEAMRLLPAFESLPKQQVENELDSLIDES